MDSGISPIPNMFESESIPSQNAHESMTRPRPLKYGLETESKTESESGVLNTDRVFVFFLTTAVLNLNSIISELVGQ